MITNFLAKYRPLKIGFLVEDGSIEDLIKAAKINTLLWGGIHNPIIPVASDTSHAEHLISVAPIDVLYPIKNTSNIEQVLKKFPFLKAPRYFMHELFQEDWRTKKNELAYLDAFNIIEKNYQKYFKGRQGSGKSNCAMIDWEKDDSLSNLFPILFGQYSSDFNLKDDFRSAFIKGLRSHELKIQKDKSLSKEFANKITPIILTGQHLKNYGRNYFRGDGVYLGDHTDFKDLLAFWNLRVVDLSIIFLPIQQVERFQEFTQEHLSRLETLNINHPNKYEPRGITFYYQNKDEKLVTEIIKKFPLKNPPFVSGTTNFYDLEFLEKLPTDNLSWEFAMGNIEKIDENYSVTINLPDKKFLPETDRDLKKQTLAMSIGAHSSFWHEGRFLNLPFFRKLNEFYSREISFDPWKIRVEEEGLAVIIDLDDKYETLRPIDQNLLIKKVLELATIPSETSQPGLLTERIIKKIDSLEGGRIFKIGGVRKLLDQLKSGDAITRGEATKTIWQDGHFKKHENLHIEYRRAPKLTVQDTFDFLLKKGFFRAGLEFQCDDCRLFSWLPMRDINDDWICEYCGHSNKTSLHIKDRGDWKFRKSGLFAKDNNQEGAVPVILTLLVFKRIFDMGGFAYTTALKLKLSSKELEKELETDFSILQYERGDQVQLAIGECKSDGGEITEEDIQNLKLARSQIESTTGMDCYLVCSKTADKFTDTEIGIFKNLFKEDQRLILLTNKELEPYNPYWEDEDVDKLPHKYALRFLQMAGNSYYRYLKPKDEVNRDPTQPKE